MSKDIVGSGQSRVWLCKSGVGPGNNFEYQGCAKIGDTTWPRGEATNVQIPDPEVYGSFINVATIPAGQQRPTSSIAQRYPIARSAFLELHRKNCRFDVHIQLGKCNSPKDFNGWEKIRVLRDCRVSSWSDENAGAYEEGDANVTNETLEFSASEMYEVTPLTFTKLLEATITREITAVAVCDKNSCGDCGNVSDGCDRIFAVMVGEGATPGTLPSVIFSKDGGVTASTVDVNTMFSNESVAGIACASDYLILVSELGGFHYALIDDIVDGTASPFVETSTGFDGSHFPSAVVAPSARTLWIAGTGGYIWYSEDPDAGVEVKDAGVATTQNLNDIHALDDNYVVAVGDSNAVVVSVNGSTFYSVTGPVVGVNLSAVFMQTDRLWFVGTEAGELYFTNDAGQNWTEISVPGSPVYIRDIQFFDDTIGYLAIDITGTHGRLLRTRDGGDTWYILPEKKSSGLIPANDKINMIALCDQPNTVFAGGLADDGSDGILLKAS